MLLVAWVAGAGAAPGVGSLMQAALSSGEKWLLSTPFSNQILFGYVPSFSSRIFVVLKPHHWFVLLGLNPSLEALPACTAP